MLRSGLSPHAAAALCAVRCTYLWLHRKTTGIYHAALRGWSNRVRGRGYHLYRKLRWDSHRVRFCAAPKPICVFARIWCKVRVIALIKAM